MNALKIQGGIFSVCALLCAAASAGLPKWDAQTELILVTVLIIALGVPHGALDTVFGKERFGLTSLGAWLRFTALYLLLVVAVVGLWYYAPGVFLAGFLVISIAHFSGDPEGDFPWWIRITQGGAVVFLPMLLHPAAIADLFALLIGPVASQTLLSIMAYLAWPWLAVSLLAVAYLTRRSLSQCLELGSLIILAVVAPPLIAFTLFFCGMHSARHILRTARYAQNTSFNFLWVAALFPMIGVAGLTLVAWWLSADHPIDSRLVQIVFVGLAALTVPHMVLVEPVRARGWIKGDNT
jgi:Brp/Blh family beta-carotene 15,15'-monooxygenase